MKIKLLDCTLRDGAYIVEGQFGKKAIRGMIEHLQNANIDIIECGWLKDDEYHEGSTYYYQPSDLSQYLPKCIKKETLYVAMIDYNRFDISRLPENSRDSIDAIRIVFPQEKTKEGLSLIKPIRDKGYKVFLQIANTFGYSDIELIRLAEDVNKHDIVGLSIVDTFGVMYEDDLNRVLMILNNHLREDIALGFHSHNNQQLSFALSMFFVETMIRYGDRDCVVDASLCGMGRGAGNTPTELLAGYLNKRFHTFYDMNVIMDTVDIYMTYFQDNYEWGYSVPYMLSGVYACHVNNIAYLTKTHRTKTKDIKNVLENMLPEYRKRYDYDYLDDVYYDVMNKQIDDSDTKAFLADHIAGKEIVAIAPGYMAKQEIGCVNEYIDGHSNVVVIGINSLLDGYRYDYLFFTNEVKYSMAIDSHEDKMKRICRIITSNIDANEKLVLNYNELIRRKWKYYDNSTIMFLWLMITLKPQKICFVGFDGYSHLNSVHYADRWLEPPIDDEEVIVLQANIREMLYEFIRINKGKIDISFLTKSDFEDLF